MPRALKVSFLHDVLVCVYTLQYIGAYSNVLNIIKNYM